MSPCPNIKGPPRKSERLQARQALVKAISTTIENPRAKLYLLQSVKSDDTDPQDDPDSPSIFVNVSVPLPLQTILKVVPGLESALSLLREALNPQGVHTTLSMELHNPISRLCTWIKVTIFDTSIIALLDRAGVESIKSNGAYFSVPLRFGELVVTYPAVVLESESYNMLIGTDFFRTYQNVFLVSKEETGRQHVCLWYSHGVLGLPYRVANASVKPLPTYGDNQKGLKMRSNQLFTITPKTQVAVDTGLYLNLPPGLHLEISSISGVSRNEPLITPGIHDSAAQETLKVLLLN
ncbi:hypothetical protein DSO57_1000624 [Entomophthora muscae]|uniref:Uncharacterized protein n=1 Tax=Entomophthora muscae TaxID=34485 RepID=A0ACC2S0E3_9FUNG|nr:hypothetical protein DSO57_1000624 [Entomophthora muscae]